MILNKAESRPLSSEEKTAKFDKEKAKEIMNMSIEDFMTDPSIDTIDGDYLNLENIDDNAWGAYNRLNESNENPAQLARLKSLLERMDYSL